jgi:hypothetical protein
MKNGEQFLGWQLDSGAGETRMYRDGSQIGLVGALGAIGWANPKIGRRADAATAFLSATVSELIVFSRVLTAAELAAVRTYLAARYALSFTPVSVADCICWLRSDLGITLNGSDVSTWADQSGAGNDVTQAVAADQPAYFSSGGSNNHPYLEFDGINDSLLGAWALNQPVTTVTTVLPSVAGGKAAESFIDGSVFDTNRHYYGFGVNLPTYYGGAAIGFGATTESTWQYWSTIGNGAASQINVNGGTPVVGDAGAGNPGGLRVGARGSGVNFIDCRMAEIAMYDRALTAEEIASLEAYMAARYGI